MNLLAILHEFRSLLFVLGVLFICSILLKKWALFRQGGDRNVRLMQSLAVGSRERILLLEVQSQKILVGVSGNHIQTLHVFSDKSQSGGD